MFKLTLLSLLGIALISCRSIPDPNRIILFEQCSPFFVYTESGDISTRESVCFCRMYQRSIVYMGAIVGNEKDKVLYPDFGVNGIDDALMFTKDRAIGYCNKLIGSTPYEYGKDFSFLELLRYDLSQVKIRR